MTFLYDIGRVLLDFDFESSLAHLLPPDCADPHARLVRLLERKDEFETGSIPVDEYIAWAIQTLESNASPDQFKDRWQNIFTPNLPMWDRVRELHQRGHRLILFSNTNGIHCPWLFEKFPEFALFHHAILSFEVAAIKPHPPIYQHALDCYQLNPADTLYIDDLPDNIATGEKFGFHCHQYNLHDHAAFDRWIAAFPL